LAELSAVTAKDGCHTIEVARQQLRREQNANPEVLAAYLHLGRPEVAENNAVARCANRQNQDTNKSNSSNAKLVIKASARCADHSCSSSASSVPKHHVEAKECTVQFIYLRSTSLRRREGGKQTPVIILLSSFFPSNILKD
jgi:Zn finger protein HypA/HybF involved in hydrogenase expression